MNDCSWNLGVWAPFAELGDHFLTIAGDGHANWSGVRSWERDRVNPDKFSDRKDIDYLLNSLGEGLPFEVGLVAVKIEERLTNLVFN